MIIISMFGRRPFDVWMKLERNQVPCFPGTPLQDHLGDPQITLYKASFLFFKKNFLLLPHIFGVHNCLDHNCFKNGRNAKLPVISRRAINVTEMRETLRAHNRQI